MTADTYNVIHAMVMLLYQTLQASGQKLWGITEKLLCPNPKGYPNHKPQYMRDRPATDRHAIDFDLNGRPKSQ